MNYRDHVLRINNLNISLKVRCGGAVYNSSYIGGIDKDGLQSEVSPGKNLRPYLKNNLKQNWLEA
jgi:hypothetical protein